MGKKTITDPNGNIFNITIPEGQNPSQSEVLDYVQQEINSGRLKPTVAQSAPTQEPIQAEESPGFVESFDGISNELMNTFTFGLADKAGDYGRVLADYATTPKSYDQSMSDNMGRSKESREKFRAKAPIAAGTASAIGALANPIGVRAGKYMSEATTLPKMMGRGSITGSGLAGAQAAGEGQDLETVAQQTAIGGAVGGVAPPVFKGLMKLWDGGGNLIARLSPQSQESLAARKIMQSMMDDGLTLEQAGARLEELGPRGALMDLGPNSRSLASAVYGVPGKGKDVIDKYVRGRHEGRYNDEALEIEGGQVNALQKDLDEIVPDNYMATKQGLDSENLAAEHYAKAYKANMYMEDTRIDRLLKTPEGADALKAAVKDMRNSMSTASRVDPELTARLQETEDWVTGLGVGRGLKLETLDLVKRKLQTEEGRLMNMGRSDEARRIGNIHRALIKRLDSLDETGGSYKLARSISQDKKLNQEALDAGTRNMRGVQTADDLKMKVGDMGPGERHHYRVGTKQAIQNKLAKTTAGGDATKGIMKDQDMFKKTKTAFGDDDLFRAWMKAVGREKELAKGYGEIIGGPKTSRDIAGQRSMFEDPNKFVSAAERFSQGHPLNPMTYLRAGKDIASGVGDRMNYTPGFSDKLAQMLTGRDTEMVQKMYQMKIMEQARQKQLIEAVTRGQVGYQ